jgi:GT2 family glycosyltransferase
LEREYPELRIIKLDRNYGFAEGYNRAIAAVDHPYVTLLNSDVMVSRGWWQPILAFLENNPDVGAVQPKIMSQREPEKFEYAGAAGGYLDKLGYPYCRGRLFDITEEDHGQYDTVADVCWASGACLTMPRELYLSLGGLDTKFFAHMEEIDLCCRVNIAGRRVCAIPDSKVYHLGGASLAQGDPKKTYLNFRNNLLLLHKNLPEKEGKRKLFLRRLMDTLALGMYLVKGDIKNARAVWDAHQDFRKMRREYSEHPDRDYLSTLPGADRNAIVARYLQGKRSLTPKENNLK